MRRFNNMLLHFMHGRLRAKDSVEALHIAAFEGDVDKIKELVSKRKVSVDAKHKSIMSSSVDCTPLFLAIDQENYEAAQVLISLGADIDERDGNNLTPLIRAATGDLKMLEILVGLGADVNASRESDGASALGFATHTDDVAKANAAEIEIGKKIVDRLILAGADVERPKSDPQSVLMLAARQNHYKIVEALLQAGADPERKCGLKWAKDWTALDHAINADHAEAIELLRGVTKTRTIARFGQA